MNDTPKTIEQQVAEAILQKATTTIQIGDTAYELAPPTPATLILISELVAGLPAINKTYKQIEKNWKVRLYRVLDLGGGRCGTEIFRF